MRTPIRALIIALLMTATLATTACQDQYGNGPGTKESVGTVGGALAGGLLGSQVGKGSGKLWATGVGTLAGAFLGNQIGASLDSADKLALSSAENQARSAPVGKEIRWNNPQSGNYGTITPTRDGTSASGDYCREFQQTISVGGKTERAYGTACRQPDGQWQIVN